MCMCVCLFVRNGRDSDKCVEGWVRDESVRKWKRWWEPVAGRWERGRD